MKVAIIGGGVAGLTQGIFLRNKGFDVTVFERAPQMENRGHAFLMSEDGIKLLETLSTERNGLLLRKKVDLFCLKRPNGEELIKIPLIEWNCLKRVDLITYLNSFYSEDELLYAHEFSHFLFDESGRAYSVVFKNNETYRADIFIGADGSNSAVRQLLFGKTSFTPIDVKEVVGIAHYCPETPYNIFQKVQSSEKGLAFGFIPVTENESVWFMQYDVNLEQVSAIKTPEELKAFCLLLLKDFPAEVHNILNKNDFSTSYIWNTRDFDLLPAFHKMNIVLIGDAAHLALPFTSVGTTNAIRDAAALTESLESERTLEDAFVSYYKKRSEELNSHIARGRELKEIFLEPKKYSERGFIIPLISEKYKPRIKAEKKPLKFSYFTDPICSTCWIFQSLLRKLHIEYDDVIEITYHMGGLLPDWISQQDKKIKSPLDAANLWQDLGKEYEIPMNGQVWIKDPLESSFPPSIAFKAAQLQDDDKAISFLRRMKELLFIENKNISKWEIIESAALHSGLDSALLKKDVEGRAPVLFQQDRDLAKELEISSFPTLVIEFMGQKVKILKGLHTYDSIEVLIRYYVPNARKSQERITSEALFQRFNNITEKEFCFLLDLDRNTGYKELDRLSQLNIIRPVETDNAVYWERCSEN